MSSIGASVAAGVVEIVSELVELVVLEGACFLHRGVHTDTHTNTHICNKSARVNKTSLF